VKVTVAADLCCGAQLCAQVAPEVYTLVDGFNSLSTADEPWTVPEGLEDKARRGARACPESAISITDDKA
jgi:ferredoxin